MLVRGNHIMKHLQHWDRFKKIQLWEASLSKEAGYESEHPTKSELEIRVRIFQSMKGNLTMKVVPLPGWLSASIVPPWANTNSLAIASPNPIPPLLRVRASSVR
jgi:hypothetical protein